MDEQRKWFLEMESTSGEDAGKIVEITRDLEYYTNLPDKAVDGSRGLTSNLKEVLLWMKGYQTALHAAEKSFVKERVN